MNTTELRIGNYIKDSKSGRIGKVILLSPFRIKAKMDKSTLYQHSEYFDKIKLTEEWLLKLGFEKGSDIMGDCYFIENATYDLDFAIHFEDGFFIYNNIRLYIHYVNDLQNLFYSLTYLELESTS